MYVFNPIPLFNSWLGFSGDVPQIFWNIQSSEQRYKFLAKHVCMLVEYASMLGYELNVTRQDMESLANDLANFKSEFADDFEDFYKQRICEWLNNNLACMIGQAAKFVQFGLTDDGHLAIHVPTNWKFLEFYTPSDFDNENYGKLCIKY